ncbi:protein new-glue 4 [Drosophila pseudoobscura]|uniref:Protein new-glue 4 n=2 Tax=pseudoobscura subgroup TaxID=32358 RepID=A0A6I8WAK2_DROPS|nr:protein new-glue 4 [Drosophila pseudoobscura]
MPMVELILKLKVLLLVLPWLLICKFLYKPADFTEPSVFYNSLDYHPEDYIDTFTTLQQEDYFQ